MTKPVKNSVELTEVRGIFAPTADHTAIKALCAVDRNMLARMVDRGWSDGDMAEYLAANDIVAAEQILKALGLRQSKPEVETPPLRRQQQTAPDPMDLIRLLESTGDRTVAPDLKQAMMKLRDEWIAKGKLPPL